MSSLRLIAPQIRAVLKNRRVVPTNLLSRRSYHYAETGGTYRSVIPPVPDDNIRWKFITAMQSFIWFWIFYNSWYEPEMLIGHVDFIRPDPSTFTDEELGLPPEGEDDEFFQ